jgi:hypothetical protein
MLRALSINSDASGTVSISELSSRLNIHHFGTLMKTGPVGDAQQTEQCVYSIPHDCGRCYISETSRLLVVRIKEHKYNLTQGLLEKTKNPS